MSEQRRGKKRPKSYYIKCAAGGKKVKKTNIISAGMKGFLVTCNKYERETVREMYNLLNEYADVMYGPELDNTATKAADTSDNDSDEEDIEKAMAKETSAIKQASIGERRFQNTDTKCNNVIFIRTTLEDPCRLAHEIFRDIQDKQVQKARYAIRMLPVAAICTPVTKDIEQTLKTVLAPHFETEFGVGINYTAACKIRNNNSVSKNMILPLLGKLIKEMNPLHRLCHDEPDLVIIIEVIQKACCFSVVKDYFKFRKYNLHEIIKKPIEDETCDKGNADKDVEDDKRDNEGSADNVDTIENIEDS
ncbi:THUMP domain-containing protein 1-like [Mercenaria mercenaria]|uniref:THUMP domain-containing protein 1-like n=1 Tax=Mercenaria mercenaria TaxID=6596 RepID=UPI00234EA0FD|nr:THUMP domain-containing protein 1-like [Mercenaria mercenaria]